MDISALKTSSILMGMVISISKQVLNDVIYDLRYTKTISIKFNQFSIFPSEKIKKKKQYYLNK